MTQAPSSVEFTSDLIFFFLLKEINAKLTAVEISLNIKMSERVENIFSLGYVYKIILITRVLRIYIAFTYTFICGLERESLLN